MEMRRKDRQISHEEALELLKNGEYGILATVSEGNMPYAVPLSYVVWENAVYFHCANDGHKLEDIKANPHVCFNVVGETKPYATENNYSSYYESVTVFGKAKIVQDEQTRRRALKVLVEKYFPQNMDTIDVIIEKASAVTTVVAIEIDKVTGKANK